MLLPQDAAVFDLSAQSIASWAKFVGVFTVVFAALFVLWVNPSVSKSSTYRKLMSMHGVEVALHEFATF
jgi:hypothetical protein